MELITKAPKGTVDIIPGESEKWSLVEAVMTDEAELNGFSEIRTPVLPAVQLRHAAYHVHARHHRRGGKADVHV